MDCTQKISIIIPIYNVEQYLAKCLDSVINQTYKNLEIICVNDCSPDNSVKILEEYAKKDSRIIIFNRDKNGGLSAARNSGMDIATGEYIYFLDSDDWIDLDYIEKMLEAALSLNAEVVLNTNILMEYENNIQRKYPTLIPNSKGQFLSIKDSINKTIMVSWAHLWKMEFIKNNRLSFPEGFIHEDVYFHYFAKILTDRTFVFEGSAYHYLQRQNSIMQTRKSKVLPSLAIYNLILEHYRNLESENKYNISVFNFLSINEIVAEEELQECKKYLIKLDDYYKNINYEYKPFEKFVLNAVLESSTIEEFSKSYGKNLQIKFLKNKHLMEAK